MRVLLTSVGLETKKIQECFFGYGREIHILSKSLIYLYSSNRCRCNKIFAQVYE